MKEPPKKPSLAASIGLTTLLVGGSCCSPVANTGLQADVQLSEEQKEQAKLLSILYDEVYQKITSHSSEELAGMLKELKWGINAFRIHDDKGIHTYIAAKSRNKDDLKGCFYIDNPSILDQIAEMNWREFALPTTEQMRDTFVAAFYAALGHEKYKELEVEGHQAQNYLGDDFVAGIVRKRITDEATCIITEGFPEMEIAAKNLRIANSPDQNPQNSPSR